MRLRDVINLVEQLTGGESQQDIVSRVEALEAGSGETTLGSNRPMATMFALPDPTKDYYVLYNWDSPNTSAVEVILYHGVPDGAGWFVAPSAADVLSVDATPGQHLEVKGKIPAGHSVFLVVNSGPNDLTVVGIEVPIA
jgi:hypothetical protein